MPAEIWLVEGGHVFEVIQWWLKNPVPDKQVDAAHQISALFSKAVGSWETTTVLL